jgi:hypothetical protein
MLVSYLRLCFRQVVVVVQIPSRARRPILSLRQDEGIALQVDTGVYATVIDLVQESIIYRSRSSRHYRSKYMATNPL